MLLTRMLKNYCGLYNCTKFGFVILTFTEIICNILCRDAPIRHWPTISRPIIGA